MGRGTQRNACQEGQRRAILARPPQPEERLQPQGMWEQFWFGYNELTCDRMRARSPTRYDTTKRSRSTIHAKNTDRGYTIFIQCTNTSIGHRCHSRQGGWRHSPREEERQAPPARYLRPDHQLRCLAINPQVRLHQATVLNSLYAIPRTNYTIFPWARADSI